MEKKKKFFSHTIIIGNIFTANENNEFVESMVLENNKIVFIGKVEDSHTYLEKNKIHFDKIRSIKLKLTQIMLPGFIDSHLHPLLGGLAKSSANLHLCGNVTEVLEKVNEFFENNPHVQYIRGVGYNDSIFTKEFPAHYKILDQINSEIPISLMRYDAHAYWCNSAAIKQAKVDRNTVSPDGGVIEKDENGEPIGIFHDGAMNLIKKSMPKLDANRKVDILIESLKYLLSHGITSFMDAAVKYENFEIYSKIFENETSLRNSLPRASLSISTKSAFFDSEMCNEKENELLENTLNKMDKFFSSKRKKNWEDGGNKFKVNSAKLFIDGVFESGTAMFSRCKCSQEDEEIESYTYSKDQLQMIVDYLYKNEIQIHTHCIGDLASKMVLNAIFNSKKKFEGTIKNNERNYLAHLQLIKNEDIKRMKELGVYANMSPFWFQEDNFTEQFEALIGEERLSDVYPIKTMLEYGIKVGFGSDWPVSTLNPLEGIEVAVTHRPLGCTFDKPAYLPEQEVSLFEAIKAYTTYSAEILGLEKLVGSIEVGKLADLIVLNKNIFQLDPWEIHTAIISHTLVDGEIVYNETLI